MMNRRIPPIDLYVADGVDQLNELAELSSVIKSKPINLLFNSAAKVLNEAQKLYSSGDDEKAYVMYMKYFTLIEIIRKKTDLSKHKNEKRQYLGTKQEIDSHMDLLEKLKRNLVERYTERREKFVAKQKQAELNKENIKTNAVVPKPVSKFILITDLFKLMKETNQKILLIDCRSINEFEASKIRYDNLINIPGEAILKGYTANTMLKKIAPQYTKLFENRASMDLVVLIDDDTSESQSNLSKPIWILRTILLEWDPDTHYKSLLLLHGGYNDFVYYYPHMTTNPKYSPKTNVETVELGDIEYPSLSEIKMKPKPDENSFSSRIPNIDRSSKPAFGQKANEQQRPNNLISIKEQEIIFDQILQKEKEVLKIGDELYNVVNVPITSNDIDPSDWFNKQTELEYKMVQKENELNDTITGLSATTIPDFEGQLETLQINSNNPEESETLARINAKKNEHSENTRKLENISKKIESKISETREKQKRHLQSQLDDEELIRPKQPAFDRTIKPSYDQPTKFPQILRDFSPIMGSYGDVGATGLKNLGNTCYMNSIIQCLLNIEGLCGYFQKDGYLRHINRKSKTHGQITEELAQLCKEVWSGKYKSVAPRDFRSVVGQENKMFASYEQQDSHEFLVILLDILHSEMQFPIEDTILSEKSPKAEIAWREFSKNMQSIIQRLFFGQIRSTLKCRTCGFESATYEGFSHLSLELPQDNRQCELYDCLDSYFNGENIEGWTCPQCKQNRGAIKKLDISKLPPVLVIHLKRFHASLDTANTYYKKQNFVHFPINDFRITDYITPSLQKQNRSLDQYNLIAVSNHYGTMNRGHYTAFCRNTNSKVWYKYDDCYVTQIGSNDVNSSAGYILFYSQL
ncbi:ubiquitin carboxyl-terminal hydrolase 8 [Contarinia nasturtii]|uniref:ubiquitin carboxyl-terminal hydrolase 8 n=1 Tax=Contarinia nasturtii TaxID=265458 RepID=UPI0012D380F2|nr:ubiquitin carboxyl-terminal hydrolase 8 [Contarinia nasturtii]